MNKNLQISIIIIGYNTRADLLKLLESINLINGSENILEVIYVDDGSSDDSYKQFKAFPMIFKKRSKKLNKNHGRAFATNSGIEMARGKWCFFVRSNEVLSPNIIIEYKKTMINKKMLAYMGLVKYKSSDSIFMKYLNDKRRGVGLKKGGEPIHYRFLLFNNSIIQTDACKQAGVNLNLRDYGGEELDFAYRLNCLYPNMICACPTAVVYRNYYPSLKKHCSRLEEFGNKNLKKLPENLQSLIVGSCFLLRAPVWVGYSISILYFFISFINAGFPNPIYSFIRIQFLLAILKGYYKTS